MNDDDCCGLNCCVRRQKDDDQEDAKDFLDKRCAPRNGWTLLRQVTKETLEALTPRAPDSVRKIDNMGARPPSKKGISSEVCTLAAQVARLQAQITRITDPIEDAAEESKAEKPLDRLDLKRMQKTLLEVAATMGEDSQAYKHYKEALEKKLTANLSSKPFKVQTEGLESKLQKKDGDLSNAKAEVSEVEVSEADNLTQKGVITPDAPNSMPKIDTMGASDISPGVLTPDAPNSMPTIDDTGGAAGVFISDAPDSVSQIEYMGGACILIQDAPDSVPNTANVGLASQDGQPSTTQVETPRFTLAPTQKYPPTAKIPKSREKETLISGVTNEASEELEGKPSLTAQTLSVNNEASEELEGTLSLIAQSFSVNEASEDLKLMQEPTAQTFSVNEASEDWELTRDLTGQSLSVASQCDDPAEELDVMPSPITRTNPPSAPSVFSRTMTQWYNSPEDRFADGEPAENEQSAHGPLQKSLTNWYSSSYTQDFSEGALADREGEAGQEAEKAPTLFYDMSQSFNPTDYITRSFVMSQPTSVSVGRGTTSNVPHVD